MKLITKENNRITLFILGIKFSFKYKSNNNNNIYVIDKNNKKKKLHRTKGLSINIKGSNNSIILYEPIPKFENTKINIISDNNEVIIHSSNEHIINSYIDMRQGKSRIEIGEKTSVEGAYFFMDYMSSINIGDNCMFSSNIAFMAGDGHTIYDSETDTINTPGNIRIGNHVWIGGGVKILKNAKICNNCIIGVDSVVTNKFNKENCAIAGNPAKIIKENLYWSRKNIKDYDPSENIETIKQKIKNGN